MSENDDELAFLNVLHISNESKRKYWVRPLWHIVVLFNETTDENRS